MHKFSLYERVFHKVSEKMIPILAPIRRSKLNCTDFTIISNNCWGGLCYEYFGIIKNSPTVGTYFFAEDYIRFVSNLKYYVGVELEIIDTSKSKHYQSLLSKGQDHVVVGRLDDVEIVFLHYSDSQIAKQKWERRTKRINWDKLIVKFSYMNECKDEHIHLFEKTDYPLKFCFSGKPFDAYDDVIVVPGSREGIVYNDTFYFNKYIDIYKLINNRVIRRK